jgi:hypothetical protein
MPTLFENVSMFEEVKHKKMQRSPETYQAVQEWAIDEISRNVASYHRYTGKLLYKKRLYRDGIDFPLRRYHEYCLQQKDGAHYIQQGLEEKGVFEHMVPLSTIRDMIIAGAITPIQGCNMPTCQISKANDQLLRDNGLASTTPDIYNFWERYNRCFNATFKTNDGNSTIPSNLEEHFSYFLG